MNKRIVSLSLILCMTAGMILPVSSAMPEVSSAEIKGVQVPRAGEHPFTPRGGLEPLGGAIFEQNLWQDDNE